MKYFRALFEAKYAPKSGVNYHFVSDAIFSFRKYHVYYVYVYKYQVQNRPVIKIELMANLEILHYLYTHASVPTSRATHS